MSDLYWLQPGWTKTRCSCGANIWDSGGDPDWGQCYECFTHSHQEPPSPPTPSCPCDICKTGDAVTEVNGRGVCSEECAEEARKLGA